MDRKVHRVLRQNRINRIKHRKWQRLMQICAAVVVFCTTYAMILPAITWDKQLICEKQEHTHEEGCYELVDGEQVPVCGLEEHTHEDGCYDAPPAEPQLYYCGKEVHTHGEDCYFSDGTLKCTMEEHAHEDACLVAPKLAEETPNWLCGLDEHSHGEDCPADCAIPEHTHDDTCLTEQTQEEKTAETPVYYCGLDEHSHGDGCYTDGTLTCTQQEHSHEEACLVKPEEKTDETPVYYCALEEHTHGEGCYTDGALTCTKQEHSHEDACLVKPEEKPVYYCGMEEHEHTDSCYQDGVLVCEILDHTHDAFCLEKPMERPMFARALFAAPPTYHVPDMVTDEPRANDWQVATGRYSSDEEKLSILTKTIKDEDGNVLRLRKNLVPTGTENEFLVYLSVEPVYYHNWVEIFKASGMLVNNANNVAEYYSKGFSNEESVTEIKNRLGVNSHSSLLVKDEYAPLSNRYTTKTSADVYINTIRLAMDDAKTQYLVLNNCNLVYSLPQNSGSSFTIIFSAANSNSSVKLSEITWDLHGRGNKADAGTLTFPAEAYRRLIDANKEMFDHIIQRSFPKLVEDPMGEHIEFKEVLYCNGTAAFSESENKLTWDLTTYNLPEPSQNPADYEQINTDDAFSRTAAYQMVYKIRLKTEDPDFVSGADSMLSTIGRGVIPTNGTTTVSYRTDKQTPGTPDRTGEFDVPTIRGLLYDITFKKVDTHGQPVAGAKFVLTKDTDPAFSRELTTTGEAKTYGFTRLQQGDYTLTETPPADYTGEQTVWHFRLCYTTDRELLGLNGNDMIYYDPASYTYDHGVWRITNVKSTKVFLFRKTNEDHMPLQGAKFKLYKDQALTEEISVGFLTSGADGIFSPEKFLLDPGEYYLVETWAPVGYHTNAPGKLEVAADRGSVRLYVEGVWYDSVSAYDEKTEMTRITLDVVNEPTVPLPATGGAGMTPVIVLGVTVLFGTWSYGIFLWRRQKGRWE